MNKNCKKMFLILIMASLGLTACGKDNNQAVTEIPTEENSGEVTPPITEPQVTEYISPLSGLSSEDPAILTKRPIAVMFDNHRAARWQAGLSEAEIVYEILAEGNITRYMGIFLKGNPERIGSVRSARPYFIVAALEYDALYVHCGGSEQAFKDIKRYKVSDMDEIRNSGAAFYRYKKTGKKGEHTLYTDIGKIRDMQAVHKYSETAQFQAFKFNQQDTDLAGAAANQVDIIYWKDNKTQYKYDTGRKVYLRLKDGKSHIDENNKNEILAKNIIIQRADTKAIDSYGRLDVKLIGKGEGQYLTNGKMIPITWEKADAHSKTIYKNLDGEEIRLNPGVTWIQVVKLKTQVDIQ